MVLMTASRLSRAIFKPSKMWARSLALPSASLKIAHQAAFSVFVNECDPTLASNHVSHVQNEFVIQVRAVPDCISQSLLIVSRKLRR